VSFHTGDGLLLSGWYVPSRNGAAIVIVHGGGGDRDGARAHAAMLARAGYGVLLYDARGRGQSQGDPDAYGWAWGRDVDAAIAWLKQRPDIKAGRIGALGLSTGADVLVEAAARRHDIRAVVAEGTTTRSLTDTAKVLHGGGLLSIPFWWIPYAAAQVLENASPGPPLATLAAHPPHPDPLHRLDVERRARITDLRAGRQPTRRPLGSQRRPHPKAYTTTPTSMSNAS